MRKIYLIAALLVMAMTVSAQVKRTGEAFEGSSYVAPRQFSYGNKLTIHAREKEGEGMEEKMTFTIYNDDIEEVRSFEFSGYVHEVRCESQQRKNNITAELIDCEQEKFNCWDDKDELLGALTWEEAKKYMLEDYYNHSLLKWDESYGYKFYYTLDNCYWGYYDGKAASYVYDYNRPIHYYEWNPDDGYIYEVTVEYETINHFTGEWETTNTTTYTTGSIESLCFDDYDDNSYPNNSTYLTQTLFNTDEKFEYIRYEYDDNATEISDERDRDGDGVIDERTVNYGVKTGFSIVQEDGTVLQTIRFNGYVDDIIKINGKLYLVGKEVIVKGPYGTYMYADAYFRIDPTANGIKRMTDPIGMVVRPAIADRDGQVTVELDGDAREIQVVNTAGQTVKRIPVGEGQQQVTFNTRGLSSGVNIVRSKGHNAEASRKFIVK